MSHYPDIILFRLFKYGSFSNYQKVAEWKWTNSHPNKNENLKELCIILFLKKKDQTKT